MYRLLTLLSTLILLSSLSSNFSLLAEEGALAEPVCPKWATLGGLDGETPVFDTPENGVIRFHLPTTALVESKSAALSNDDTWCLIGDPSTLSMGWVPLRSLTPTQEGHVYASSLRLCGGSLSGPSNPCYLVNESVIWIKWHYWGLREGDWVQYMVTVDGERYSSPPYKWQHGKVGGVVEELSSWAPTPQGTVWTVEVIVNGIPIRHLTLR